MSLQVHNIISEREQIVALRRQAVFMFIATHLDADGCFCGSDQYIANTVASSDRKSVNRIRKALEESGDVMIVNEERRYDSRGKLLPNRVRPVPIKTFWLREWIRQGSKAAETALDTSGRSVQGETGSSRPRLHASNDAGVTQESSAPVSKAKTLGRDHKNSIPLTESLHSLSVEQQSTARSTCRSVQGEPSTKYIDPPVKRAIAQRRAQIEKIRTSTSMYRTMPEKERAEVQRIEREIAELEGK